MKVERAQDDSTLQIWGGGRPSFGGLQVNDSALQRDGDGVRSVVCAKFGKDVLDVTLDRFLGNRESIGDQLVCIPAGNQAQHIDFSGGQGVIDRVVGEFSGDLGRNALLASMYSANRLEEFLPQ